MRFSLNFKSGTLAVMDSNTSLSGSAMPASKTHTATLPIAPNTGNAESITEGTLPFVMGSLLLGTIGVFVYEAHADPLTATWFRCAFGLLGLTLWIALRGQLRGLLLPGASWRWAVVAGILMVSGWALFFAAIERTSASVATVLFHIQPLWVLLLGAWLLKASIARRRLVSVFIAMGGLVLSTGMLGHVSWTNDDADKSRQADYWLGVGFCLIGALCTAGVTLIAKRLCAAPAGVLAWWQCGVGTLVLLIWPIYHGWPSWGTSWVWLSGMGLIHTALAYSLLYAGVARLRTDRIAVLQFIYPAVTIMIDWLFYDHGLGADQLLGIVVMSVAIWSTELNKSSTCTINSRT